MFVFAPPASVPVAIGALYIKSKFSNDNVVNVKFLEEFVI